MTHYHRHTDNGRNDGEEDSKVDEASRSFTGLKFRRPLEAAALPLVDVAFVVVVTVVVAVDVTVNVDDASFNV